MCMMYRHNRAKVHGASAPHTLSGRCRDSSCLTLLVCTSSALLGSGCCYAWMMLINRVNIISYLSACNQPRTGHGQHKPLASKAYTQTLKVCSQWCRPYQSGEVIVQNYNSLLTLAHLAEVSDGIMLVENSALHYTCQRLLNIPRPSFTVSPHGMQVHLPISHAQMCRKHIFSCCMSCCMWHICLPCACCCLRHANVDMVPSHSAGHERCGSTCPVVRSPACLLPTHHRYAHTADIIVTCACVPTGHLLRAK